MLDPQIILSKSALNEGIAAVSNLKAKKTKKLTAARSAKKDETSLSNSKP
jgi:hypothetical protein